tara:strand:+ start:1324 stop:1749 length:426 start_codon:yes stop_codon:yes gene_type:complete
MKKISASENLMPDSIQTGFKQTKNIEEPKKKKNRSSRKRESGIPKNVANRMARRIAITTGIPTISGMSVFIASYYLIIKGITDIPPVITLVTSGACFLVGLVGLSYGILSASWDENNGTLLGLENIRPNIKRMKEAFRSSD